MIREVLLFTKPRGGGLKALVDRPLKKEFICGFQCSVIYDIIIISVFVKQSVYFKSYYSFDFAPT